MRSRAMEAAKGWEPMGCPPTAVADLLPSVARWQVSVKGTLARPCSFYAGSLDHPTPRGPVQTGRERGCRATDWLISAVAAQTTAGPDRSHNITCATQAG